VDAAFLARARAFAEAQFPDTCRITKPGEPDPDAVMDPDTLQYPEPTPTTVYEGICKIPRRSAALTSGAAAAAGEASWEVGEYPLDLPIDGTGYQDGAGPVKPGMTVTILTAANDPELVNEEFGITEPSRQSTATVRRFRMKQVVSD
jgi:hypothetical protein